MIPLGCMRFYFGSHLSPIDMYQDMLRDNGTEVGRDRVDAASGGGTNSHQFAPEVMMLRGAGWRTVEALGRRVVESRLGVEVMRSPFAVVLIWRVEETVASCNLWGGLLVSGSSDSQEGHD